MISELQKNCITTVGEFRLEKRSQANWCNKIWMANSLQKSIKIDNHKDASDRFLSISDSNRLISIDYDRLRSISIEYRKYRFVTSWYIWGSSARRPLRKYKIETAKSTVLYVLLMVVFFVLFFWSAWMVTSFCLFSCFATLNGLTFII